jgi:hypothetical protein
MKIEYVLEGYYLQRDGTRVWKEHSHADTKDRAFNPHLGVDTTNKVGQPSKWRVTERGLTQLFAVQGHYPRRGKREWLDHTARVDLATARRVYSWFHRLCQDPNYDSPNKARVVNMGTGEVVEMTGFVAPTKNPGETVACIPVTPEEWEAVRQHFYSWGSSLSRGKRKAYPGFVWKSGRDYIVGYEDEKGNIRVRPGHYKPARS